MSNILVEGWQPIEEYFKEKGRYDWVLVKYFDRDYECIPAVMEFRDEKWYYNNSDKPLKECFTPKYFFSMKQLDGEKE